jgi:hypothetical protein
MCQPTRKGRQPQAERQLIQKPDLKARNKKDDLISRNKTRLTNNKNRNMTDWLLPTKTRRTQDDKDWGDW